MREGYWINYKTGQAHLIDEHSYWIKGPGNARKLGLPQNAIKEMEKFKLPDDREKLLIYVLYHAPVMRVRGHDTFVTFEFASHNRTDPMDTIFLWAKKNLGQYTMLNIVNLATRESVQMNLMDFQAKVEDGGYQAVLRAASSFNKKLAKRILSIARSVLSSDCV